ncbi:hypothetical protein N665_0031s0039, partial [Sinapis alba]
QWVGSSSTNIHFDYDGHYSKSRDNYEWISTNGRLYVISFKTSLMEEITYSFLKERILEPKRQSYILDDEDVFVYLTSMDKEQRRSILHVEVIKELEIVPITEQQSESRVEKVSSYGGNYSELASGIPKFEGNPSAVTIFTPIEEATHYLKGIERVENVVNGKEDDVGIVLDNMSVDNEENMDNSMGMVLFASTLSCHMLQKKF